MGFLLGLYYGWATKTILDSSESRQTDQKDHEPKEVFPVDSKPLPASVSSIVCLALALVAYVASRYVHNLYLGVDPDPGYGGVNDTTRSIYRLLEIGGIAFAVVNASFSLFHAFRCVRRKGFNS